MSIIQIDCVQIKRVLRKWRLELFAIQLFLYKFLISNYPAVHVRMSNYALYTLYFEIIINWITVFHKKL